MIFINPEFKITHIKNKLKKGGKGEIGKVGGWGGKMPYPNYTFYVYIPSPQRGNPEICYY